MPSKPFNVDIELKGGSSLIRPRLHPTTLANVGTAYNGQIYFETATGAKRLWYYDEDAAAFIKIPRLDYAETASGLWTFNRSGAPFAIGAQSSGYRVAGLNADGIPDSGDGSFTMRLGATTASANTVVIRDSAGRAKVVGPSADDDVANKYYVDSVAQGLIIHQEVACATTENISLSGEQTIDGVSIENATPVRVLVKNQTNATENGIYVTGSGSWSRAADENTWAEFYKAYCVVTNGTINGSSSWVCTVGSSGTLGVDNITHQKFFQVGQYYAGNGMAKDGNFFHAITASAYTINALVYANTSSTLAFIAPNALATKKFLTSASSGVPAWDTIASSDISEVVMDVMGTAIIDSDTVDFTYIDASDQFSASVRLKSGGSISSDSSGIFTIQDIRTTASPTFAGLTLSGLTTGGLVKATASTGALALATAGTDYQAVLWDAVSTDLRPHSGYSTVTIGIGGRPVNIAGTGYVTIQGDSGTWAMEYAFKGSAGTHKGGFGVLGSADTLSYYYIGSYGSELLKLSSTLITPAADATRDLGASSDRFKNGYFSGAVQSTQLHFGASYSYLYYAGGVVGPVGSAAVYGSFISFCGRDQTSNQGTIAFTGDIRNADANAGRVIISQYDGTSIIRAYWNKSGHFLPGNTGATNGYDIGASGTAWRNGYFSGAFVCGSATIGTLTGVVKASTGAISASAIVNADVEASAAIAWTKMATITAYGSAATVFLTQVSNTVYSRTAAQVLSDIGAAAAVHTHDYQPLDPTLTALAGLSTSANKVILVTGEDAFNAGQIETAYIANSNVTYAKIQNVSAQNRILGRVSASVATVAELAKADVLDMIDLGSGDSVNFASLTLSGLLAANSASLGALALVDFSGVLRADPETGNVTASADLPSGTTINSKSIARKVVIELAAGSNHWSYAHNLNTLDFTYSIRNDSSKVYEDAQVKAYDANTVHVDTTSNTTDKLWLIITI